MYNIIETARDNLKKVKMFKVRHMHNTTIYNIIETAKDVYKNIV